MKYQKAIIRDKTYKVSSNDKFINVTADTNQSSNLITGFDNAFPIFLLSILRSDALEHGSNSEVIKLKRYFDHRCL